VLRRHLIFGAAPHRALLWCWGFLLFFEFLSHACAAPPSLTLQHKHFLFTLTSSDMRRWQRPQETWTYRGRAVVPPTSFRVDGDHVSPLPDGWQRHTITGWNRSTIAVTLERKIAADFDRPAGSVTIGKSMSGGIIFEGVGLPGRTVDIAATTDLILGAIERNIDHITLPVRETPATVTVTDSSLLDAGIREVVTVGESDFSGSPVNRRYNIGVGIARFNGTLIQRNSDFSFDKILGRVDQTTGYRKELVIKGERTEPDYGGGLCQISTTAYRGVWEYGFPILKRKNHSFAVHYYGPQGTDATVYPPNIDMQFRNDGPGALLIQTYIEGSKAYFVYYGTRDTRSTELIGPYMWGHKDPPPPRTELTIEIPPGETKKVGSPVPGVHALWYRVVHQNGKEHTEPVASIYEARPLYTLIGVRPEELPASASGSIVPTEP